MKTLNVPEITVDFNELERVQAQALHGARDTLRQSLINLSYPLIGEYDQLREDIRELQRKQQQVWTSLAYARQCNHYLAFDLHKWHEDLMDMIHERQIMLSKYANVMYQCIIDARRAIHVINAQSATERRDQYVHYDEPMTVDGDNWPASLTAKQIGTLCNVIEYTQTPLYLAHLDIIEKEMLNEPS